MFLTAGGLLQIQNPAFSPLVATTSAIPLNQWFRVEGYVLAGAGTGQVALKLFDSNNSSVPTEFHTSAAAQTLGTNVNIALIGLSTSTASFGPFWMGNLGISTTGYLGPRNRGGGGGGGGGGPFWMDRHRPVHHRLHRPREPHGGSGTSIVPSLIAAGAI